MGIHTLGDLAHRRTFLHRGALNERKRVLFLHAELVDQSTLGPIDHLARFEFLLERIDVTGQDLKFTEAPDGHLDGRNEVALLIRLHQIRQCTGIARLLDDLALTERREHEHAADALLADHLGNLETVHARHLHVEDREVGLEFANEFQRVVAPSGLAHHVVALFTKGLQQIEADDRLVLGDDDTDAHMVIQPPDCSIPEGGQARICSSSRSCFDSSSAMAARIESR